MSFTGTFSAAWSHRAPRGCAPPGLSVDWPDGCGSRSAHGDLGWDTGRLDEGAHRLPARRRFLDVREMAVYHNRRLSDLARAVVGGSETV
jgi:hypothetical protein